MTTPALRADVQVLRAIAVLAVMVFHFDARLLPGGYVGVDIFLVISGYLIASILFRLQSTPGLPAHQVLLTFYGTRLRRIVPAYLLMLVVTAAVAAVFFLPNDFTIFRKSLNSALRFTSNNYFAHFGDYFAPANHEQPLLHTWSLAVEVQFYMLAPLLLLIPGRALRWVLPLLAVAFTAYAEYRLRILHIEQATYYSLLARLPAFFIGALVYKVAPVISRSTFAHGRLVVVLAWGMIAWSFYQPAISGFFPGASALVPAIGTALLLAFNPLLPANAVYSNRFLGWVGNLSYSLYLWHWPVLALLRYYNSDPVLGWELGTAFLGLTLFFATLSYYLVETPLRKGKGPLQISLAVALTAALMMALLGAPRLNVTLSPTLSLEHTRYADPETVCHGKVVRECLQGDVAATREVLVLGDSHAAMLNHYFDYLGKRLGFKARVITASSCVTIPNFDQSRLPEWSRPDCSSQIEVARRYIMQGTPIFLAASWAWQFEQPSFARDLESFLHEHASADHPVYLMGQEPLFDRNPMRSHRFLSIGVPAFVNLSDKFIEANKKLYELAVELPNVIYWDPMRIPIFRGAPFLEGELIYYDEHHLNEIGVKEYARQSVSNFEKMIKD